MTDKDNAILDYDELVTYFAGLEQHIDVGTPKESLYCPLAYYLQRRKQIQTAAVCAFWIDFVAQGPGLGGQIPERIDMPLWGRMFIEAVDGIAKDHVTADDCLAILERLERVARPERISGDCDNADDTGGY